MFLAIQCVEEEGRALLWQPFNSKVQEGNPPHVARLTSGGRQVMTVHKSDIHKPLPYAADHWTQGLNKTHPGINNAEVWQSQVKHRGGKKELGLGAAFDKAQTKQLRLQIPPSLAKYISDIWKSTITNS